jgi:hypothetical protein
MDEVVAVMGTPESISNYAYNGKTSWGYGPSSVLFQNGRVSEWSNIGGNLKVTLNKFLKIPPLDVHDVQNYIPPEVILTKKLHVRDENLPGNPHVQLEVGQSLKILAVNGPNLLAQLDAHRYSIPLDSTDFLDRVLAEADRNLR